MFELFFVIVQYGDIKSWKYWIFYKVLSKIEHFLILYMNYNNCKSYINNCKWITEIFSFSENSIFISNCQLCSDDNNEGWEKSIIFNFSLIFISRRSQFLSADKNNHQKPKAMRNIQLSYQEQADPK